MWNSQAENAGSILVASSKVLRRKCNIFGHGVLNRSAPKATDLTNEVELTASSAVVADYPALPNHGRRDRLISRGGFKGSTQHLVSDSVHDYSPRRSQWLPT
jgi:hypothetical protein